MGLVFRSADLEHNEQYGSEYSFVVWSILILRLCLLLSIREWYAGFLQDCPNGKLTPGTFIEMYQMFFPSGDAEKFCQNVFRTFDADKSGTIDFKEFLMAIDVTSAGTPREKLLWAFR